MRPGAGMLRAHPHTLTETTMTLSLRRRDWLTRLAAFAGTSGLPLATFAAPLLHVPPMTLTRRTLANGLDVVAQPGGAGGSVSVQVWYRVGGKDDPVGRSGFAHLFEHLMFKATRHLKSEQFDRLTEDVGGQNNAFTAEDVTAYQNVVPSHHLERLLWAEAERMSNLSVDDAGFKSERAVVQEEFRQRVLAAPYGRLFEAIAPNAFDVHPYKRPVIGSIEDLDAATLDDVRAFHATYYRPDNAVLIVTGDFDPAELNRWVDRYFAPLKHPAGAVPRVTVKEPVRTASREVALTGPNVPLPATLMIWQGPSARHPDRAALQVAQALLSAGESARMNESLVYRQQVAQSAGFEAQFYTDAGSLVAYAIAAGKQQPKALVKPLMAELERLARRPISAAELDKVRSQLLTTALTARQTPLGRADAIGWAMIHHDDPQAANLALTQLQAVTAADVQRVLRTWVLGRPRTTLSYTAQARKEGA
ncbi:MAG: peptidase M16 [Burkholderiales bacterium PBB6]|nr:MAG: peptidase M16 [Burkholderiales bacterium PBB6]